MSSTPSLVRPEPGHSSHSAVPASSRVDELAEPARELHARFDELVLPYRAALWAYARRLTGNAWDAEDLVQETLLRAFAKLPRFYQALETRAYLFRIATNAWIDRARQSRGAWVELDEASGVAVEEPSWERADVDAALERLVALLPPRQRVIVLLTVAFDFTAPEVAAMLGTTAGAVKAALHRARVALAQPAAGAERSERREGGAAPELVVKFVEAFNRRDPDAIAALLDSEATNEIVGVAEEQGRTVSRANSLAEWAAGHGTELAEIGHVDGEPAVLVYDLLDGGTRALSWLIRLETAGERIVRQRQYYFCPELIAYAAEQAGVPAHTHGHRYVGADAPDAPSAA
ncbi:MAG TPA: sigma-70 family RNA polymerase sigma factor [Gemmatimonadaceae bacterium]|nr:sigma-70 family RNA polymerase sigma factor [Gemmatimonadaceae bacterium]